MGTPSRLIGVGRKLLAGEHRLPTTNSRGSRTGCPRAEHGVDSLVARLFGPAHCRSESHEYHVGSPRENLGPKRTATSRTLPSENGDSTEPRCRDSTSDNLSISQLALVCFLGVLAGRRRLLSIVTICCGPARHNRSSLKDSRVRLALRRNAVPGAARFLYSQPSFFPAQPPSRPEGSYTKARRIEPHTRAGPFDCKSHYL
jgi:hypothetical protein